MKAIPSVKLKQRKRRALLVKLAVTVTALAALLYFADRDALLRHAARLEWATLFLAISLAAGQIIVTSVRWWVILRSRMGRLPFFRLLEIHLIGLLVNSFLLNGVGTILVRAGLATRLHVPISTGAASVVADKLAAIGGLAILILATAPFFSLIAGTSLWSAAGWAAVVAVILLALVLGVAAIPATAAYRSKAMAFVAGLWGEGKALAGDYVMVARALGLTILSQAFLFLAAYVIARGIGIALPLWQLLVVLPAVSFFASIPISVGGWGVREGAMVFGLSLLGVGFEPALTLSVLIGVTSVIAILPASALCVLHRNRTLFRTVRHEAG